MNGHLNFIDTVAMGSIPRCCFLLAINYGLFDESNGKKLGARLKRIK
jgi:hypothetical protein